jgi:hypothetical protein
LPVKQRYRETGGIRVTDLRKQLLALLIAMMVLLTASDAAKPSPSGIRGTVVHKVEHAPIQNVFVLVRSQVSDEHLQTDGRGSFTVHLPPGTYDVFLSALGFSPFCRKVEVQRDAMTSLDMVLETNTLGMEK